MSRKSSRLGQFDDVKHILDAALTTSGGEVELPTYGEAVHWRQRAYRFRKLFAETISVNSPYDKLSFPRIEEGSRKVLIKVGVTKAIFTPNSPVIAEPLPVDDPLLQYALRKRAEIDQADDPSDLGDEPL